MFIEFGEVNNTDTLQQELEHGGQLNKIDDTSGEKTHTKN